MELAALKQEFASVYLALQSFNAPDLRQRARQEHLLTAGRVIGSAVNTGQRFAPMIASSLSKLLGTDIGNAGAGVAATMALWIEAARALMQNAGTQLSGFETAVYYLPWILFAAGIGLLWWVGYKHGKA